MAGVRSDGSRLVGGGVRLVERGWGESGGTLTLQLVEDLSH